MPLIFQFVLAVGLLAGGIVWMYVQLFITHDPRPLPVAAAVIAIFAGIGWLYGDFIFPLTQKGRRRERRGPEEDRAHG